MRRNGMIVIGCVLFLFVVAPYSFAEDQSEWRERSRRATRELRDYNERVRRERLERKLYEERSWHEATMEKLLQESNDIQEQRNNEAWVGLGGN